MAKITKFEQFLIAQKLYAECRFSVGSASTRFWWVAISKLDTQTNMIHGTGRNRNTLERRLMREYYRKYPEAKINEIPFVPNV